MSELHSFTNYNPLVGHGYKKIQQTSIKHSVRINWLHEIYQREHCALYYLEIVCYEFLISVKFIVNVFTYVYIYVYVSISIFLYLYL